MKTYIQENLFTQKIGKAQNVTKNGEKVNKKQSALPKNQSIFVPKS
jgi:hypothetical protein